MKKDKIEIKKELYLYMDDFFNGEINEVAKRIQTIPEMLKEANMDVRNNPDVWLRFELNMEYVGWDGGYEFKLYGFRLETDKEFETRLAVQKEIKRNKKLSKERQEEAERKLLQELKLKYEK